MLVAQVIHDLAKQPSKHNHLPNDSDKTHGSPFIPHSSSRTGPPHVTTAQVGRTSTSSSIFLCAHSQPQTLKLSSASCSDDWI